MKTALFPLSGDPFHKGHQDIVSRTAALFDKVYVGIGNYSKKKYLFSVEERVEMARHCLAPLENVEVVSYNDLLVDHAYRVGANTVVRAIRNNNDFEFESLLDTAGKTQGPFIDTIALFADPKLGHVSSTMAKEIQAYNGDLFEYVSPFVKQRLENRMSGQYFVGLTGEMGSGKSYVGKQFEQFAQQVGIQLHNIEYDHLGHRIHARTDSPHYRQTRDQINRAFGDSVMNPDGTTNHKALGKMVLHNQDAMDRLDEIMKVPLHLEARTAMQGKKGIILLNAATLGEANMGFKCNYNAVLVQVDSPTQHERLIARGTPEEMIEPAKALQWSFEQKKAALEERIKQHRHGQLWVINNGRSAPAEEIRNTFDAIVEYFGIKKEK